MSYQCDYTWSFRVNTDASLRQRIGSALRRLADALDRRVSLAVEIETTPRITTDDKVACVKFGLGRIRWAVEDTVRNACVEQILELKRKEKHGTPT